MTQAKTLLIVAHGQPSEPEPPEAHMEALAARVAGHLPGWEVRSATIATPGKLAELGQSLPDDALIYPFFMADGWFTQENLPRKLGPRRFRQLAPFGLDPALPVLAAQWLVAEAAQRGWPPEDLSVMLAAHGSGRSHRPAEVALDFTDKLAAQLPATRFTVGFVEQDPRLVDAARGLGPQSLCLPFFALEGGHVLDDLPEALGQVEYQGHRLPVLGDHPQVPALIAAAARMAA
ncbi:sirohydrochlorin chelatase [Mesobacterium pallidum]|uniref:sirohydrochlorin chelatase n=1 Tax=Mesobacterium pallidum TaxID=2872037 RepID=UPI001EE1F28F|nr:CbiX/SirB N-terminal domain-containing protein [Mesobacterium pallidum]